MTVPTTIRRTNPLPAFPNPGKDRAVRTMLRAWLEAADGVAAVQWHLFFETGTFHTHLAVNQTGTNATTFEFGPWSGLPDSPKPGACCKIAR